MLKVLRVLKIMAYVDEEKRIAKEHDVKVCDVYSTWEKLIKGDVNTTELLANKLPSN